MFTSLLCFSSSMVTFAQTNAESLQKIQKDLEQKSIEKQSVNQEIENVQQEMASLNTYISKNKEAMAVTQNKISAMNQLIEEKKEEIVTLEDKILARKNVMKKRLVALQHDNNLSLVIKVFLDAKSFDDLLQRASAVTALFNADQSILTAQKDDLTQIEVDKKEIDSQQQNLVAEQTVLAKQEADLSSNLQKRQETLTAMQEKYSQIDQQMAQAQKEKNGIVAQLQAAQAKIRQEQDAARQAASSSAVQSGNTSEPVGKGEEMYVTATSYSPQSSGAITTLGYNIKANPNMKLIAVDPSVIPLGKKVWVEGYGVAIAGDTGGAIKGHIIDVLMPTSGAALSWGRKTVKIIILN
jgi:3D (Asp-Asp-Asp) domain-containing protein